MTERSCEWCGDTFKQNRAIQRFCSDKCGNAQRNARWVANKPEGRQAVLERYRERNRERVREANRRYVKANPDRVLERTRLYRATNPEKHRAHQMVNSAIRRGQLERAERCESCGAAEALLHAHHADYARPLDVQWLCPQCHRTVHMEGVAA